MREIIADECYSYAGSRRRVASRLYLRQLSQGREKERDGVLDPGKIYQSRLVAARS